MSARRLPPAVRKLFAQKLATSGLDLADAKALGFEALSREQVTAMHPNVVQACAFKIPYYSADGSLRRDVSRLRLLEDAVGRFGEKKAKPLRYLQNPGSPPAAYFARNADEWERVLQASSVDLLITEGELKAACACKHGLPCIGLGGVWSWRSGRRGMSLLPELAEINWGGRKVTIAYDSDAVTNPQVMRASTALAEELANRGAKVCIATLPSIEGIEKTGLDDLLVRQGPEALRKVVEAASAWADFASAQIVVGTDMERVVDAAEFAFAAGENVYQRGRMLVRVERDAGTLGFLRRSPNTPSIAPLPLPSLREKMASSTRWLSMSKKGGLRQTHPPDWAVSALMSRAEWPHVPILDGVCESPVILEDGRVVIEPGYDPSCRLLLVTQGLEGLNVPDAPSREDAVRALGVLREVVVDFPFLSEAHFSAWLAALLTSFARFSFSGQIPLVLIDGNVRGIGKSLLVDVITTIATGRRAARMANVTDDDEMRKRLLSVALAGTPLVLIDNVAGVLGTPSLDMALTGQAITDRLLGQSKQVTVRLDCEFFATGNNVELVGDLVRRVLPIRLESPLERPDARSEFKHPDLLTWCAENRRKLVAAGLTILRAHFVAGRPKSPAARWGSFEGWQDTVCAAIAWLGLEPPETPRVELIEANSDSTNLAVLLHGLRELAPRQQDARTAVELIGAIEHSRDLAQVRAVIMELCPGRDGGLPDAKRFAYRLRSYKGRVVGGLRLTQGPRSHHEQTRWFVEDVAAPAARVGRTRPARGSAGHGGHGEHRYRRIGKGKEIKPRSSAKHDPHRHHAPADVGGSNANKKLRF
jgi:hypothetical protein